MKILKQVLTFILIKSSTTNCKIKKDKKKYFFASFFITNQIDIHNFSASEKK